MAPQVARGLGVAQTPGVAPVGKRFVIAAALLCLGVTQAVAARPAKQARGGTDYAPELATTRIKKKAKAPTRKALRPPARTAPARSLVRPGLRRVRADALARFASTASGGAVDIRMGAATRIHIAKRKISLRVELPGGAGGGATSLVLRGRLIGDGADGALAVAFTGADVRRTRGGIQLREAVTDVGAIRGTLRLEGDELAIDVSGLDGVADKSFGMPSSGARLTLRAVAGQGLAGAPRSGRSVTTLNMTSFALGDGVEALRWIVEVDEPGLGSRRYEVGGVLDLTTRSLHGMTVASVGGRRFDPRQLEPILERTVLNSLRGRGDDLRIVGGIRQAD